LIEQLAALIHPLSLVSSIIGVPISLSTASQGNIGSKSAQTMSLSGCLEIQKSQQENGIVSFLS
jgi:hypothetical protein